MELDLENPLPSLEDSPPFSSSSSSSLFLLESDQMPRDRYSNSTLNANAIDVSVRRQAISSISQLCCNPSDPFLSYLAINYLDRFLASREMLLVEEMVNPLQQPPKTPSWVVKLIAVSCVSLATKMRRTEPSLCDMMLFQQGDGEDLVFEKRTIGRMEYIILGALKWRMRSITPFSFLSLFTPLFKLQDHALRDVLKARAIQIILRAQMDIQAVDFKPSVVAASALMSASSELFPQQQPPCFQDSISVADKEKLRKCYGVVQELAGEEEYYYYESVVWRSSKTPVNVLDMQFSSSSESEHTRDAINPESDPGMRRRRRRRRRRTIASDDSNTNPAG